MIRNLTVSYMLAVTLAQGVGPALAAYSPAPTSVVSVSTLAATTTSVAPVQQQRAGAAQLSSAEMGGVRGDGFFSWIKKFVKVITTIISILGAIKTILNGLVTLFETTPSTVEGGETQQRTETQTVQYNSEADYNAGIVASDNTQATSSWQQTEVWYGDGCGGGGGDRGGMYMQEQMMTTC